MNKWLKQGFFLCFEGELILYMTKQILFSIIITEIKYIDLWDCQGTGENLRSLPSSDNQ